MEISINKSYYVSINESYVYLKYDGGLRTCKKKGSITSGTKLIHLSKFDLYKAIDSGLLRLEEVK